MRPLTAAAVGLGFVVLDYRVLALDLVPDPLGWALLVYALARLAVPWLGLLAGVGMLCSFAEVWLPYYYRKVETFQAGPIDGAPRLIEIEVLEYDPVTGVRLALMAATVVILGVVVVFLLRLLHERAQPYAAARTMKALRIAGIATLVTWAVPRLVLMLVAALDDGEFDAVWNDPTWRIDLVATIAAFAFMTLLVTNAREPWALRPGRLRLGNWHDRWSAPADG